MNNTFFFFLLIINNLFSIILKGNVTAAADVDTLKSHNITSILTVDSVPLLLQSPTIKNKYVQGIYYTTEKLLYL